jgi:hypothetical protein
MSHNLVFVPEAEGDSIRRWAVVGIAGSLDSEKLFYVAAPLIA